MSVAVDLLPIKLHYFLSHLAQICVLISLRYTTFSHGKIESKSREYVRDIPFIGLPILICGGYLACKCSRLTLAIIATQVVQLFCLWHTFLFSRISEGRDYLIHFGIFFTLTLGFDRLVYSLTDTLCYEILGSTRRHAFGLQRVWGSISTFIFLLSVNFIEDALGGRSLFKAEKPKQNADDLSVEPETIPFPMFIVVVMAHIFILLDILLLYRFETPKVSYDQQVDPTEKITRCRIGAFIGCILIGGIVHVFDNMLILPFIWVFSALGSGNELFVGIFILFTSFQIVGFLLSGCFIEKLGHFGVFGFRLIPSVLFFILHSFAYSEVIFIVICSSFILNNTFYAAMTNFIDIIAPRHKAAFIQSSVHALFVISGSDQLLWRPSFAQMNNDTGLVIAGVLVILVVITPLIGFVLHSRRNQTTTEPQTYQMTEALNEDSLG